MDIILIILTIAVALVFAYVVVRFLLLLFFSFLGWLRIRGLRRHARTKRPKKTRDITKEWYEKTQAGKGDDVRLKKRPRLERMNNPEQELEEELQKETIVGVREPIGFWTNLVTSRFMGQLNLQSFDPNQGFWVNFLRSQQPSKGKGGQRDR